MADTGTLADRRYSRFAALGAVLGIASVGALFVAAAGYRAGHGEFPFVPPELHWDYKFALGTIVQYAAYAGIAAGVFGLIGLGATLRGAAKRGFVAALIAIVLGFGGGGKIAELYMKVRSNPFIHDITTDTANPPDFVDVVGAREAFAQVSLDKLNGLEYTAEIALQQNAAQQRSGYPDLSPVETREAPSVVFDKALALVESEGWEVVASAPAEGRIEATIMTPYFKFRDDVVLRIAAAGSGTRVDMRSASRVGRSDVGVNAGRIAGFLGRLRIITGG